MTLIDLRSDTVTRPTAAMRAAMSNAPVGDDVLGDDPTVNALEARVADLLGKEAALYVPSGTMSNQIAVKVHTQPGDELLCDVDCHIYNYEVGGPAVLSGVTCRPLNSTFGILQPAQLEEALRPDDLHQVRTKLVCLENTHNRGGGRVYPLDLIEAISTWAKSHRLIMHLDGARLWNAAVATGIPLGKWAEPFDTVSVCFSKGLGAPIGSALAGPRATIKEARRIRKLFGGGMRQAGIAAAGALHALDHHLERLADDHRHAQLLATAIRETPGLSLYPPEVETNLVWFRVDPALGTAHALTERLREKGVLVYASNVRTLRACTHLDVSTEQAEYAAEAIRSIKAKVMEFKPLHDWNLTPPAAVALQRELAGSVDTSSALGDYEFVAGADVSYNRFSPIFYAAVVLLRRSDMQVVEVASAVGESRFPYISGLLSFREAPILLQAFANLKGRPDVVMVDGQGLAHPRCLGIACHLGLWLDVPTIGCGKTRLVGTYEELGPKAGDTSPLTARGAVVGDVVRTKLRTNPLFVSPGHRLDRASAVRVVLECGRYRIPEPTRQAHLHVNEIRRQG